jgi:hypothetical protein
MDVAVGLGGSSLSYRHDFYRKKREEMEQPGFPKTACGRICYPSVDIALRSVRVNEAGVRSRFPNPACATKYQSLP